MYISCISKYNKTKFSFLTKFCLYHIAQGRWWVFVFVPISILVLLVVNPFAKFVQRVIAISTSSTLSVFLSAGISCSVSYTYSVDSIQHGLFFKNSHQILSMARPQVKIWIVCGESDVLHSLRQAKICKPHEIAL